MPPTRYSFIVADRATGHVRRFTIRIRLVASLVTLAIALPIGWALLRHGAALNEINRLQAEQARLEIENARYRNAAVALSRDIASLQSAIGQLSARVARTSSAEPPIERMPRAMRTAVGHRDATHVPAPTFGLLSDLLGTLDHGIRLLQYDVARREAIAGALPTVWPADGWVSSGYGYRRDPFTGDREFHAAVDISTRSGDPVYATAHGRVISARRSGNYGNLIEIEHGFGIQTRYGHLSEFAVLPGTTVRRGDVIGYVGATGRATGSHVHYEVLADGRPVNPLRLLADRQSDLAAN
ncbi:MAG: M23 family metallopeptidase [Acidobacteria bacterium]|nr:M23 family metallopeptidase [Acidobacteriota bacterium]